jgi:putative membrane protein
MMGYGPMMGWMWIWSLLGLAVLAMLVWLAVRLTARPDATGASPARRFLDDRYARGEIDEEEYRRRRAGLT